MLSISAYFPLIYLFSISHRRRPAALQTVFLYEIRKEAKPSSCTEQARIRSNRFHYPTVCAPYTDMCICTVRVSGCSYGCYRNSERKVGVCVCWGGRRCQWTIQRQCTVLQEFSASKSMNLSPSFSLNPTSLPLLSFSSSTFHL